jgi:hypothetical protein
LASYAGVSFEYLDLCTDEADENVLMAIGSTHETNAEQVTDIIHALQTEFTDSIVVIYDYDETLLKCSQGDRRATLHINMKPEEAERTDTSYWNDEPPTMLTAAVCEQLKQAMTYKEDELECTLFITNDTFDAALEEAYYLPGRMMYYH